MGAMGDWLKKFYGTVAAARDGSERENLLCEQDDIKVARQLLAHREIDIMRRLRELDGLPERRAAYQSPQTFDARHPAMAETLRLKSFDEPLLPFGRNELRLVKKDKP